MAAIGFCQQAISHNLNSVKAHFLAALVYYEGGFIEHAEFELEIAGFINADFFLTHWLRSRIENNSDILKQARIKFQETGAPSLEDICISPERRAAILADLNV